MAVAGEVVGFVQGPANALCDAALNLTLHVGGMDSLACVLDGGIAENGHLARIRVHLYVHNVGGESASSAPGVEAGAAHHGAACGV